MISGITVELTVKTQNGVDALNVPTYTEVKEQVPNVLAAPLTGQELADSVTLTGRRAVYTLYIPKGDDHEWENTEVKLFGEKFRTVGPVLELIEANVPGPWNRRVNIERVEA